MRGSTGAERLRSTWNASHLAPILGCKGGASRTGETQGVNACRGVRGTRRGEQPEGPGPAEPTGQRSPPCHRCSCKRSRAGKAEPEEQEKRAAEQTYRVVDPPHEHTEQRVAGPEQLHFLSHEVLLLGLGLARQDGGRQVAGGRHGRSLGPLHRLAAKAGDPPSLHAGPGRQPHPPGQPPLRHCSSPAPPALGPGRSLRPLRALSCLSCSCARLAPPPGSRPPRLGAQPAAGPGGRRLPRWAPAS